MRAPARRAEEQRHHPCPQGGAPGARASMMHFMPQTMGRMPQMAQAQAKRSSWSPSVSNEAKENQAGTVPAAALTRHARFPAPSARSCSRVRRCCARCTCLVSGQRD